MSDFASRLLHVRSDLGLTQRELALEVGISTVQLSRYESGKSSPRPPVLSKLAKALGVSREWLETGSGTIESTPTITVASTKQNPGSYEVTFELDAVTAAAIQNSAKAQGIEPGAFLTRLVFQQIEQQVRNHPTLSKQEIESIALEVKQLLAAEDKPGK